MNKGQCFKSESLNSEVTWWWRGLRRKQSWNALTKASPDQRIGFEDFEFPCPLCAGSTKIPVTLCCFLFSGGQITMQEYLIGMVEGRLRTTTRA